ncbi:MAG: hypothetical protein IPL87_04145 [Candidatus Moraniibacteriota bacterium]|nr:MAG: hypothetical protein IPL87_04145 [Candidatus Moranbacteria bacterium]
MKYIAKFSPISVDPVAAEEDTRNEFYRRPCNSCNGKNLGEFRLTQEGPRQFSYGDGEKVIREQWLSVVVSDLFSHFVSCGEKITNFFAGNPPRPAEFSIGAGYTAYITRGKNPVVLAETYVACSGNAVVVIHKRDMDVLYISSARHGIPGLAMRYRGMEPLEVVMYDSLRTDAEWYECGLEHPDEVNRRKQEEEEKTIPGWKYQEVGEELEARIT